MTRTAPFAFARVHPHRPLTAPTLEGFLLRLASDATKAPVVFEVRSRSTPGDRQSFISYWLGVPPEHLRWVRRTLHDLIPGSVVEPDVTEHCRGPVTCAARLKISPPTLALATDRPELASRAVLSALDQMLLADEELVLQVVLGPRRSPSHRRRHLADPSRPWWRSALEGPVPAPAVVLRQHEVRQHMAGIATCIRFGVRAADPERRERLLLGLLGGYSTVKAPGTFLKLRRERPSHLNEARPPFIWDVAPSARELVSLIGWPVGDGEFPGLPPLHPRQLPVPRGLRERGEQDRIIGESATSSEAVPIGISAADSLFHLIATGPTGSGKSTALLHLIRADIHAGHAVAVIDPKWQLVRDVVERAISEDRIDDVAILDPSDSHVPGFNPLDASGRDPDVVVDGLLAVFAAVFADGWGPRSQDITHAGLLTLARAGVENSEQGREPFTLLDLPRLFSDPAFRRPIIGCLASDPGLGSFWAWYESQSPPSQAAAVAAPANKWRQYLMRPSVRRILGQLRPRLHLRNLFRERRIVLVPLNEGLIGPITAQLLGSLIVAEFWAATLERATETDPTSRPASIWIDEAQNFMHLPTALDQALAASRSMGVSWALAHQYRAQMPKSMLAAVDSNARNKIVFRPGDSQEAGAYARMTPDLEPVDFMSLGRFEAYATVLAGGAQQPWCSVRTRPAPAETELGERIREASRQRYGRTTSPDVPADGPTSSEQTTEPIGRKLKGGR